eukprot:gene3697-4606_t
MIEIGTQVRDVNSGLIGIVERGNNANGYFVNFGARKNWKRAAEIELIQSINLSKPTTSVSASTAPTTVGTVPNRTPQLNSPSPVDSNKKSISPPSSVSVQGYIPPTSGQQQTRIIPKVQSEDPGPRFGNFKFTNTAQVNPKYSTLPSKAFFDASSPDKRFITGTNNINNTNNTNKLSRPGIPNFSSPSSVNTNTQSPQKPIQPPVVPQQTQTPPPPQQQQPITTQRPTPIVQTPSPNPKPSIPQFKSPVVQQQQQPTTNNITPQKTTTPPPTPTATNTEPPKTPKKDTWFIDYSELTFDNVIGSGKYGEVSLGSWLGTPVAIKRILESSAETKIMIERELQILKDIKHPHIVQFLGATEHKGEIFIVTEFMEGGDLFDALIFGDTPLGWKAKLRITLDIAYACRYLQARGILHRDLKSQNILLSSNNRAKLCDLGLARVLEDQINKRLTFVGSDRWMAPEVSMGEMYDFKVDVFSFGVVLQEIITNQIPEERKAAKGFIFDAPSFLRRIPSDCPPAFSKLTVDCCATNPKQRPSFIQILDTVKEIYESLPEDEEIQDEIVDE